MKIEGFAKLIPPCLHNELGAVFYSGRNAFEEPSARLYILGLNPKGSYLGTVAEHTHCVLNCEPDGWSSYKDGPPCAKCGTRPPIRSTIRPKMMYLFKKLGISPGSVPSSNLFFRKSASSAEIETRQRNALKQACWPFHEAVLQKLDIRVVLCLGKEVDKWVRKQVGANDKVDCFIEEYDNRHCESWVHKNKKTGLTVVGLSHPRYADWTKPKADPTELAVKAIEGHYDPRRTTPS